MAKICLIHGPNLNLLGQREPTIYGSTTLTDIQDSFEEHCRSLGHKAISFQSNHEGALLDFLHEEARDCDFIVINPGALTHTSIALRDALAGINIPFIEVHISNTFSRESFRHQSYISDLAKGIIVGLGVQGYVLALSAAHGLLEETN